LIHTARPHRGRATWAFLKLAAMRIFVMKDKFTRDLERGLNAGLAKAGLTPQQLRQRRRDTRRPALVTSLPKLNRTHSGPRRRKFLPGQRELFV
jgi:hypothetical protein